MTCIVGVEGVGGAMLAGDSLSGNNNHFKRHGTPKVFRRGDLLLGYTDSFRWGQILKWRLEVPERESGTDEAYMATAFSDALRRCVDEAGYPKKDSEREQGGFALAVYEGRVWRIQSNFDVTYNADGYDAVGAGQDIALGALHATEGADPETRVWAALRACGEHSPWVAPPYHMIREGEDAPTEVAA